MPDENSADKNTNDKQQAVEGSRPDADPSKQSPESPSEAFKQGVSLLWKAARGAADEIKREVAKGSVGEALQQAGRDLEQAANQAAKGIEQLIEKVQPPPPNYSKEWPPAKSPPPANDEAATDGGTTETGERRDMRIQLEDD